jgi:hypothetical protein
MAGRGDRVSRRQEPVLSMRGIVSGLAGVCVLALILAPLPAEAEPQHRPPTQVQGGANNGVQTTVRDQQKSSGSSGSSGAWPAGVSGGPPGPRCSYTVVTGDMWGRVPGVNEAWAIPGEYPGPSEEGGYFLRECGGGTPTLVWIGDGAPVGGRPVVVVTPQMLAVEARDTLVLPDPVVELNPSADEPYQLVNFPIWWWNTRWEVLGQRTAAGRVWAEVTATPVASRFEGGDGGRRVCAGRGLAWRPQYSDRNGRACLYTYRKAADAYEATVTTTWRVTWVGSGDTGGELEPMYTSTVIPLRVFERHALNVYPTG